MDIKFWGSQKLINEKNAQEGKNESEYLQTDNDYAWKSYVYIWWNIKLIPSKHEKKIIVSTLLLSLLLFNIVLNELDFKIFKRNICIKYKDNSKKNYLKLVLKLFLLKGKIFILKY